MKHNIICLNCNKRGHTYKKCTNPINSYGIIIFKKCRCNTIKYLLIQRKHSHSLLELILCKYLVDSSGTSLIMGTGISSEGDGDVSVDIYKLITIVKHLPFNERQLIMMHDFDTIWEIIWRWKPIEHNDVYREYFYMVRKEYLQYLFSSMIPIHKTQLWEFPKGKKNLGETDFECATRECYEETTLTNNDYYIYPNLKLFQDKYKGTNCKLYCNNYYIGELINTHKLVYYKHDSVMQNTEIRKIGWFTYEKALEKIDASHTDMIKHINTLLNLWKFPPREIYTNGSH